MSGRSKRQRRAPAFFGREEAEEGLEALQESSEEEERPKKQRARRSRAEEEWQQQEEEAEAEEESEEEEAEPAEEETAAAAPRGGGRGGRQKRQRSAPAPPAAPMSRQDFISALHACPTLLDAILKPDGLRTVTLLARDAASLAIALGCSAEEMSGAWRTLAARAAGGDGQEGFAGTNAEALAAARKAVRDDAARQQRCTKSNAKSDWRLSDKDMAGLDFVSRHNPIFGGLAAPTKLYCLLDCLAIAHRKFGDIAGIQAAKQAGKERGAKEIEEALAAAGLPMPSLKRSKEVKDFIKHGRTGAADVVAAIGAAKEAKAQHSKREAELRTKLRAEGLGGEAWVGQPIYDFLEGKPAGTLAAAVAHIKQTKEQREGVAQRRTALQQALVAAGLLPASGTPEAQAYPARSWDGSYAGFTGAYDYIQSGTGSVAAVVAARQQVVDADAQQEQRRTELQQALVAAGLLPAPGTPETGNSPARYWDSDYGGFDGAAAYIQRRKGSVAAVVAARRQKEDERAQLEGRRTELQQALVAAGLLPAPGAPEAPDAGVFLNGWASIESAYGYIQRGQGSLAAVVEAGRQRLAAQVQRAERTARLQQALAAAGLQDLQTYQYYVTGLSPYVRDGTGLDSDEAAVEAVRQWQQQQDQQKQRRQHVRQLREAEGLSDAYDSRIQSYITTGQGSDEELLAAAREAHQRVNQPHRYSLMAEREQRVVKLLLANGLPEYYAFTCSTIAYYIETGNGSDAAALADAKKHHERKPYVAAGAAAAAAAAPEAGAGDAGLADAMQE